MLASIRLSFEFPVKAKVDSDRKNGSLNPDILPAWWAWCCGWTETPTWELRKGVKSRFNNEYNRAMANHEGTGISQLTREYARSICHWHICEAMLERELLPLLDDEDFADYHRIFDEFGLGERERGWLLTRIYPFDNFLGVPKFIALTPDGTLRERAGDRSRRVWLQEREMPMKSGFQRRAESRR